MLFWTFKFISVTGTSEWKRSYISCTPHTMPSMSHSSSRAPPVTFRFASGVDLWLRCRWSAVLLLTISWCPCLECHVVNYRRPVSVTWERRIKICAPNVLIAGCRQTCGRPLDLPYAAWYTSIWSDCELTSMQDSIWFSLRRLSRTRQSWRATWTYGATSGSFVVAVPLATLATFPPEGRERQRRRWWRREKPPLRRKSRFSLIAN